MNDLSNSASSAAASAHMRVWSTHFHDPAASAERARALLATLNPASECAACAWCAITVGYFYLFYSAQPEDARGWLTQAQEGFIHVGDRRGELLSAIGVARLRLTHGDALGARKMLLELQDEARQLLAPQDRFYELNALGATFFYTDELDQTIRYLYEGLRVLRVLGTTPQLPTLLSNLAAVLVTVGDFEPARDLAREALALLQQFNNPQLVLFARSNLAEALRGVGEDDAALATVEAMLQSSEKDLVKSAQNHYCAIATEVYASRDMFDRADTCLAAAKAIFETYPGGFNEVHYRWAAAMLAAARRPDAQALPEIEEAARTAERLNHVSTLCKTYALLAQRYAELNRYAEAYRAQKRLFEVHTKRMSNRASVKYYLLKVEQQLADARAERDRAEAQRRQLEAASRQLERLNTELQCKVREVEELQARLREEAIHDPLTQLFNRRYLDSTLLRLLDASARRGEPLALALLDLDHFKLVNDEHGHLAGDQVLMQIAQLFVASLRTSDLVCRYGGEEFCLVLPGTEAQAARDLLSGLAERMHTLSVAYRDSVLTQFTFSAGIAASPAHGSTPGELILAADRALYAAKSAGRNCTLIAER